MVQQDTTTRSTSVVEFLRILHQPGDVFEIRAPKCPTKRGGTYRTTHAGYFNDIEQAAKAAAQLDDLGPPGVYLTINPVRPDLLARAANRIQAGATNTTSDADVLGRRWLLIDIDPKRPAGTSATDGEMQAALDLGRRVRAWLDAREWPSPLFGMSGSGSYLLYRIDLPNGDAETELLKRVLQALHAEHSTEAAEVDTSTFNASRICKLFGTTARKGDDLRGVEGLDDRPHRMAWFEVPEHELDPVPRELLEQVGELAPKPERPQAPQRNGATHGHVSHMAYDRCRAYLAKLPPAIEGNGGSGVTLQAACEIYRFGLEGSEAWQLLAEYNQRCEPPWTERELQHKLDDARAKVEGDGSFGSRVQDESRARARPVQDRRPGQESAERLAESVQPIRNYTETPGDDDGRPRRAPLPMAGIIQQTMRKTGGWPRRVGNVLFVDDPKHGIGWFDKPNELFGWMQSRVGRVDWRGGTSYVGKSELYAELSRTAQPYESIEDLPHEPQLEGHYYRCSSVTASDGSRLAELLGRFCPATDADHDLLKSAFLTPGWGGPHGCRPCYVITSDDGRGAGKTTIVKTIGQVWGGLLSFSDKEDVNKIKTRLLSPDALVRRVALLDNVKSHRFSWAELEGMITASSIGGHRMYHGEGTRPNTLTWFITLNGASLSTDMAQRAIIAKVRRPERSARWEDETREFVETHRMDIIGDIIGELRRRGDHLQKFSRWATWERDVLNCVAEPGEAQAVIAERQSTVDVEADEADTVEGYLADQLRRLHYDTDTERVFISSHIATRWFCQAVNEHKGAVAVGRILGQFIDEGRMPRLSRSSGRSLGRGWIWTGPNWDFEAATKCDLEERMSRHETRT